MADQIISAHFQALFESALRAYKKKTGITLAEHPLTVQLESCHSIEDITTILQRQAEAVDDLQARDRIIKSLKTTVSILALLSVAVGLVRLNVLVSCFRSLTVFVQTFPPSKAIQAALAIVLDVRAAFQLRFSTFRLISK